MSESYDRYLHYPVRDGCLFHPSSNVIVNMTNGDCKQQFSLIWRIIHHYMWEACDNNAIVRRNLFPLLEKKLLMVEAQLRTQSVIHDNIQSLMDESYEYRQAYNNLIMDFVSFNQGVFG